VRIVNKDTKNQSTKP